MSKKVNILPGFTLCSDCKKEGRGKLGKIVKWMGVYTCNKYPYLHETYTEQEVNIISQPEWRR